jgi:hypothetical protein
VQISNVRTDVETANVDAMNKRNVVIAGPQLDTAGIIAT